MSTTPAADAERAVADWRRIPLGELLRRMAVEYDGFRTLTINDAYGTPGDQNDPNTPLQF